MCRSETISLVIWMTAIWKPPLESESRMRTKCRYCWKTLKFSKWEIYFRCAEFENLTYGERARTSDLFGQSNWWPYIVSAEVSIKCFGFLQKNSPPILSSFSTVSAHSGPPSHGSERRPSARKRPPAMIDNMLAGQKPYNQIAMWRVEVGAET